MLPIGLLGGGKVGDTGDCWFPKGRGSCIVDIGAPVAEKPGNPEGVDWEGEKNGGTLADASEPELE